MLERRVEAANQHMHGAQAPHTRPLRRDRSHSTCMRVSAQCSAPLPPPSFSSFSSSSPPLATPPSLPPGPLRGGKPVTPEPVQSKQKLPQTSPRSRGGSSAYDLEEIISNNLYGSELWAQQTCWLGQAGLACRLGKCKKAV